MLAGLVPGGFFLFISVVAAAAAIIWSVVALSRAKITQVGRSRAIAGLVLGIATLILTLVWLGIR